MDVIRRLGSALLACDFCAADSRARQRAGAKSVAETTNRRISFHTLVSHSTEMPQFDAATHGAKQPEHSALSVRLSGAHKI